MPKLTEEQLNAIKSLPYYSNVKDLIPLYESGVLSQDEFNEELLKARENCKAKPFNFGMEMVLIEGGTFQMGSSHQGDSEKPVHSVTVSGFYIGTYQVTQEQYQAVMGKNPSHSKGDNLPVEWVRWYDVVEFCNKLSELEGLQECYSGSGENITCNFEANGYRLPTEAEWEYAARGGNQSRGYKFSGSNNIDEVAWYRERILWNSAVTTHPVGAKKANELGIYDMTGNVWEWCWDWYDRDYYKNCPIGDPKGQSAGFSRVLRGGSWDSVEAYDLLAFRAFAAPVGRSNHFGFRVARTK